MDDYPDKKLMKLVIKKDHRAFKILFDRYNGPIYNFILKYTGNRELGQDLLQETFTRVWFAAHTFDLKRGNFKGWIYKIALNITRNEMAKKRYNYQYFDVSEIYDNQIEPAYPGTEQPDVMLDRSDLRDIIFNALKQLKPHLREIIIFRLYQQLKFKEIAQITDTPEGTLKARFHHAIAKLKKLLEPVGI